ncbi:ribonuclease CAF1 [Syncephalastrum racemosum]|uniref:Ribonuclease CAF1 n=1 Tax=Syncephalastrum racemosum TaxID=13706 RepID=A0A1X2HM47_SYNRA|nr:ribonuclease CAF1 [Syncephalastrum racemosum]
MPRERSVAYNEVNNENLSTIYDNVLAKVASADAIALDTEFTGFCARVVKHMDQRYESLAAVVRSHAILSVGLTTIANTSDGFLVDNFELLTTRSGTFQVDTKNLQFLAENGFNFTRHFMLGMGYEPGVPSAALESATTKEKSARGLFRDILRLIRSKRIPIVVHNGFLDLMYIYHSFITELPAQFKTFVADLLDVFPGGIYDTKYLTAQVLYEQRTFLAYLFCKFQRKSVDWSLTVQNALVLPQPSRKRKREPEKICRSYSNYGYCPNGRLCLDSHDLDRILDRDEKKLNTSSDSKADASASRLETEQVENIAKETSTLAAQDDHASYFDAYMTAYVFCHLTKALEPDAMKQEINRVYLMRLNVPLRLVESIYAKPSTAWLEVKKLFTVQENE